MKKLYNQPQTQWVVNIENASDLMQLILGTLTAKEPGTTGTGTPLRNFTGDKQSLKYLI